MGHPLVVYVTKLGLGNEERFGGGIASDNEKTPSEIPRVFAIQFNPVFLSPYCLN